MNIKISHWYGRLGNNIIQVYNALHLALHLNCNVIIPVHNYFNKSYLIINKDIEKAANIIMNDIFFEKEPYHTTHKEAFSKNTATVINIIRDLFKIHTSDTLNNNDVVIHIRGGDVFHNRNNNPNSWYVMPPLSYYTQIIDKYKFDKIYIISEDRTNPVLNILLEMYKNIEFKIQSLNEDIALLLKAQHVIASFGSFCTSLVMCSTNIKTFHVPSYYYKYPADNYIPFITHDLDNYYKIMFPWKNSDSQRAHMMNYKMKLV